MTTTNRLPVMGWWAVNREEFDRGLHHFELKYGLEPKVVFVNLKHDGWEFPDELEVIPTAMPVNHYIIANTVEDFDATGERRSTNAPVSSVSNTWKEES